MTVGKGRLQPLANGGMSRKHTFFMGFVSCVVESIVSLVAILLTSFVVPMLSYALSFAAGAMLYIVVEDLISKSQEGEHSNVGTIDKALDFSLMMILDVALS